MDETRGQDPQVLSALLSDLAAQPDMAHTLEGITKLAVDTIPGCDEAGVTIRRGKRLMTPAATGAVVGEVDQLQYDLREGPCVDSVATAETYVIDDTTTDARWPRWAPGAASLGIRSCLSVRLTSTVDVVAALNLYARAAEAFDDDAVQLAHEYATYAGSALAVSHQVSTLQSALQTRHTIGVAQGILRHRHAISVEQAFQVLVRISRDHNIVLRDLARTVVEQNGLPTAFTSTAERARARRDWTP